ncbi:MAG: hypothetical protein A3I09_01715 [Deltaproteobacteria bacterium RIFCSPLOWO2_02_FULL_47_10]|nr:MAG: hypothetical protein A3I09_01715 [Deltaproteobacteria bacterium RIFCSPLOWO2_02_FULL_47_10]
MVKTGSEILLSEYAHLLEGRRVGVLAHAASVDSEGRHIADRLMQEAESGGWKVAALFGPEHGLQGAAQDMEPVGHAQLANPRSQIPNPKQASNPKSQIPIYSLYGNSFASLSPTPEMLKDIDVLVVDLQDIGSRYYTYANTMALCIRACSAAGKEVIVCDRPNPINGVDKEGGTVDPEFRSFVGMFPVPVRHGMTIGEIAKQFCSGGLHIIPTQGWNRGHFWDETGLKWINPSPNMRSLTAALLYPGMCLMEGTNISEGRGTRTPFETIGAPWVDGEELAKKLRSLKLAGIDCDPVVFTPTARKFENDRCEGIQFIITDRRKFRPYLTGLALIHTISSLYRKHFKWRREPYEFVDDIPAIDLLTGNSRFRKLIDKGKPLEEIMGVVKNATFQGVVKNA